MVTCPLPFEVDYRQLFHDIITYIKENLESLIQNEKLTKLVELILSNCGKKNSRGLVLVRTRSHTKAISEFLKNHPDLKVFNKLF